MKVVDGEWLVTLGGDDLLVQRYAASFTSDNLTIVHRDGQYHLRVREFAGLTNASDVRTRAIEIVQRMNRIAWLRGFGSNRIEVGAVIWQEPNGNRHIYVSVEETIGVCGSVGVLEIREDGSREMIRPNVENVASLLQLADEDSNVDRVLRLCGDYDATWVNLYRVYDAIEGYVGGERVVQQHGWATRNRIQRFTRTASSPDAVGDEARHGRPVGDPPPNPMTLAEGTAFVKHIVECWLRSKAS